MHPEQRACDALIAPPGRPISTEPSKPTIRPSPPRSPPPMDGIVNPPLPGVIVLPVPARNAPIRPLRS
jgi:hypothetical protein